MTKRLNIYKKHYRKINNAFGLNIYNDVKTEEELLKFDALCVIKTAEELTEELHVTLARVDSTLNKLGMRFIKINATYVIYKPNIFAKNSNEHIMVLFDKKVLQKAILKDYNVDCCWVNIDNMPIDTMLRSLAWDIINKPDADISDYAKIIAYNVSMFSINNNSSH